MGNDVFANGREVSCKAADGKSICCFPDVCFTPPENPATPPGVPVPYPNTGLAKDATGGSKKVKISGKEVMLKNQSHFKKSIGDEAGCAAKKGVVTSTNRGKVYFTSWSMDVKYEGKNVVRHFDMTTHNHMSTPGNTIPWLYVDSMSSSQVTPGCKRQANKFNKECKKHVKELSEAQGGGMNLAGTNSAMCDDDECKKARECVLTPYNLGCCDGKTPHHVIPKQELCEKGSKGKTPLPGNTGYNEQDAPCICVDGGNPGVPDDDGYLTEHAIMHNAYKQGRTDHLEAGKTWDYPQCKKVASEAVEKESSCKAKCVEDQVAKYHDSKVTEVTVSQQKSYSGPRRPSSTPAWN